MKNYITAIFVFAFAFVGIKQMHAQTENAWKTLSKITFRKQYDDMLGFKVDVPVFSDDVKKLSEQEVQIKGYIIPVEGYKSHTEFVFSETVMEVYAKEPIKYTAEAVAIRGKLELNDSDVNRLIYALHDAVLVEKIK